MACSSLGWIVVLVASRLDRKSQFLDSVQDRDIDHTCRREAAVAGSRSARVADDEGEDRTKRRLATAFGWVAGGAVGLLLNYGLLLAVGDAYPTTWTTFVLFLLGAFAGMALADRLGPRAFKPLGVAAGVLLALFVGVVLAVLMSPAGT